jgi:hypothetical protein
MDGIVRDGFRDGFGWRTEDGAVRRGVWLSSLPLFDAPFDRDIVIALHIAPDVLAGHEFGAPAFNTRIWCVPAALIQSNARISHHWQSTPTMGSWPGAPPPRKTPLGHTSAPEP